MKKSLMVIALLTLSLLLVVACGNPSPTTSTSVQTPASTPTATEELFLEIMEPADESVVDVSRITVSGKTLADAVLSINGAIADVDYQGIFIEEVNLDAGPNIIEIIASDFYGNEESAILTVIYATALPLTVSEPLNESTVMSPTVTVKGTTNEDAVVSINGKIISVDASGNFNEPVSLDLGPNFIEVLASDFYGNSASVVITVIYNP